MTTETMTIHRGLAELKVLENRIIKTISGAKFCAAAKQSMKMPTIVFRRLKELDFYSDEIIQQTMDENERSIRWAMQNKKFEDDAGKCSYLMAIIRNNIGAVYRREKDKAEKTVKNNAEPNLDTMIDLSMIGTAHKGKDVSSLLGGDDLWI